MIGARTAGAMTMIAFVAACRSGAPHDARAVTVTAPDSSTPSLVASDAGSASADASTAVQEAVQEEGWPLAAIVVDERAAYWFASAHDLVTQKPTGEGAPVVLAKADGQPAALALDANRVYWVEADGLVAVERADGTKRIVAKLTRPRGLVLEERAAFVVADDGETTSAVFRVPLDGGAPAKLAAVPATTMTLAGDAASIFVVTDEVLRIPKTGGTAKKVSASPEEAQTIVLVRDDIVFVGIDPQASIGRVWKMPKRGPARPASPNTTVMYAGAVPVSGEGGSVSALATDGRRAFWVKTPDDPDAKEGVLQTSSGKETPTDLGVVSTGSGIAVARGRIHWASRDGVRSIALPR